MNHIKERKVYLGPQNFNIFRKLSTTLNILDELSGQKRALYMSGFAQKCIFFIPLSILLPENALYFYVTICVYPFNFSFSYLDSA